MSSRLILQSCDFKFTSSAFKKPLTKATYSVVATQQWLSLNQRPSDY